MDQGVTDTGMFCLGLIVCSDETSVVTSPEQLTELREAAFQTLQDVIETTLVSPEGNTTEEELAMSLGVLNEISGMV